MHEHPKKKQNESLKRNYVRPGSFVIRVYPQYAYRRKSIVSCILRVQLDELGTRYAALLRDVVKKRNSLFQLVLSGSACAPGDTQPDVCVSDIFTGELRNNADSESSRHLPAVNGACRAFSLMTYNEAVSTQRFEGGTRNSGNVPFVQLGFFGAAFHLPGLGKAA